MSGPAQTLIKKLPASGICKEVNDKKCEGRPMQRRFFMLQGGAVVKCYEETVSVTSIQINDQKNASITYSFSGG